MKAKGLDPDSSSNLSGGINYGFPVVQALAIAGQLPGGVTRTQLPAGAAQHGHDLADAAARASSSTWTA